MFQIFCLTLDCLPELKERLARLVQLFPLLFIHIAINATARAALHITSIADFWQQERGKGQGAVGKVTPSGGPGGGLSLSSKGKNLRQK